MIARLRSYLAGSGLGPTLVKALTGNAGLRIAGMGFGFFLAGVQVLGWSARRDLAAMCADTRRWQRDIPEGYA